MKNETHLQHFGIFTEETLRHTGFISPIQRRAVEIEEEFLGNQSLSHGIDVFSPIDGLMKPLCGVSFPQLRFQNVSQVSHYLPVEGEVLSNIVYKTLISGIMDTNKAKVL